MLRANVTSLASPGICIYGPCTYRNVIRASNFACTLSHSPTMCSIPLLLIQYTYHKRGVDSAVEISYSIDNQFWMGGVSILTPLII